MEGVKRKNRKKKIRILVQIVILIALAVFIYQKYYEGSYDQVDREANTDKFIAISYQGVEKYNSQSTSRISQERLGEHLEALKAMGYETISQNQVEELYEGDTLVPEKSLFLMFEDGRRDTGVFAHELLKENNYIATMMTYAQKFVDKDNRFLSARDMTILMDTSFWEHGSNGYRLEYINVFDRQRNFYGHIGTDEFTALSTEMGRDYDHYLMDYIRDEDRLPVETYGEMVERILWDYDAMENIYKEYLEEAPSFYGIMHANTGQFGTNDEVSMINESKLRKNFAINFNREFYPENTIDTSPYELTRMQVQPNWYANHLIMRIVDDTGEEPVFVVGDENESKNWNLGAGAAEFRSNEYVVTSEAHGSGSISTAVDLNNVNIQLNLEGNMAGVQSIILSDRKNIAKQVTFTLDYNVLIVSQKTSDLEVLLHTLDLDELEENLNIDDDKKEAIGTQDSKDIISLNDRGYRSLEIIIENNMLKLLVDDYEVIDDMNLSQDLDLGILILEASVNSSIQDQYSERNLVDNVYDGVFTDLVISDSSTGQIRYSYIKTGVDLVVEKVKTWYEKFTTIIMERF